MESILEKYEKELESGELRHITLSHIFCEMFDRNFDQKVISIFGKLSKVYPKKTILLALLDMYDMDNVDFNNNWYGLLVWFIKSRMDKKIAVTNPTINLSERARKLQKEFGKLE